ncbi:DNA-packaging protein [Flavobacterium coralii]|uniref:DNA-packaging protein n=1 Tax=Flavobacterium coralii TaxID=2838017 RepID=UPI000C654E50|nr:DNA packaging protein [Flavobacterium sp.]|tara:strand:- start:22751 stop:23218 length:468 start_codon:yes stop_codon:yes gene_type:complete
MAAPIGNQFWKLRSKHGRDKLFSTPELLWDAACEYFEWCDNNPLTEDNIEVIRVNGIGDEIKRVPKYKMRPYTLNGLCIYLDCCTEYFRKFEDNNKDSKDFITVITRIREIIYEQKFSGAAAGFFNANIIARDLGLSEKQSISVTEQPLFPEDTE